MWSFLDGVFGTSGTTILNAAFALGVVLVLAVLALWALKFVFRTSSGVARGRNRRLMVVDNLPLDQRRQLLILRRDNVEHLVMIGGAQDLVIETGIPAEQAGLRPQMRRAAGLRASPLRAQRSGRNADQPELEEPPAERLHEAGAGQPLRRSASLRHTGLMRQDGRVEPAVIHDNSAFNGKAFPDSAKTRLGNGRAASAESDPNGQAPGDEEDYYGPHRGGLREER